MNTRDTPTDRLYREFAHLWPLMSPPGEYAAEAAHWRTVLGEKLGPGRHRLLELGVGGGHNLLHLAPDFNAVAVDLSDEMLAQCRKLIPGIETHVGDMRSIRLGQTFDAVLIHDAISHMRTEDDLLAAFRTAVAHLRPGGVFLTSPDRYREQFHSPEAETVTHSDGQTTFTYFEYAWDPDPADTTIEVLLTYLIQDPQGLRIEQDRMELGLFPRATWLRRMKQAGFAIEPRAFSLPDWPRPYELLVGVRH